MPAYPFPQQKLFFSKEEEEKGGEGGKVSSDPLSIPFEFGNQSSHRKGGKGRLVPLQLASVSLVFVFLDLKQDGEKILLSVYA